MCWGRAQSPAPLGGQSLSHRTGGVEQDPAPGQACRSCLSLFKVFIPQLLGHDPWRSLALPHPCTPGAADSWAADSWVGSQGGTLPGPQSQGLSASTLKETQLA